MMSPSPDKSKVVAKYLDVAVSFSTYAAAVTSGIAVFLVLLPAPIAYLWGDHSTKSDKPPELAEYTSGWLGGGGSLNSICTPKKEEYEQLYPKFTIIVQGLEARSNNGFGQVEYKYTCKFIAQAR